MDFHNHVIPGVDDGARDLEEGVAAVASFRVEGVRTVVATPHFPASHTERPDIMLERLEAMDEAFDLLRTGVARRGLDVRLERGAEVRLNTPEPDLSDRRLRLAGTHFALVEFSAFRLPPYGDEQLAGLRQAGWIPVLAHPERYAGVGEALDVAASWREHAFFQVNAGSLLGEYGPAARRAARALLERGWVDYVSSDYHARGLPGLSPARDLLLEAEGIASDPSDVSEGEQDGESEGEEDGDGGGREVPVARLVMEVNPGRLLANREPLPVPRLEMGSGVWDRLRGLFR